MLKGFVLGCFPGFRVQPFCVPRAGRQINRLQDFNVFPQKRLQTLGFARKRNVKLHGVRFARFRKRICREFRFDTANDRNVRLHAREIKAMQKAF